MVITIVGYPKDVEEVYFGENGILENADKGTYVIDMTTTSPKLDQQIYEEAKNRGLHGLDAPVTGGDSGAKAGTLTILVGGDKEDFDTCLPVFEAMGKAINYEGKSGNGQHTKMCNQIAIAGALAGACEAMVYAKNAGLDVDVMLKSISTGAAGSAQMNNVASKAAKDDYAPGFFLKHFIKDMSLADEEASERGHPLFCFGTSRLRHAGEMPSRNRTYASDTCPHEIYRAYAIQRRTLWRKRDPERNNLF